MLNAMNSRKKNLQSILLLNEIKKIMNHFKSSVLILALSFIFLWQPITHAQKVDIAVLAPIINFLLEEQSEGVFECPSFEPNIVIDENGVLISIEVPEGQTIDGDVIIGTQQELDQLSGVTRINGNLLLSPVFSFVSSDSLAFDVDMLPFDLSPLDSLLEVTRSISVRTTNTDLDAFNCLQYVGEGLSIFNNESLESVDGFRSLESIGVNLSITSNESLQSISGFQALESVGNRFSVSINAVLKNINSFNALNSVGRDLQISFNPGLERISGFQQLGSIGNDLNIFNNDVLRSVIGFSELESVNFDLNISNNPSLEGIGSLSALDRSDVSGNIVIQSNALFDCGLPVPNFFVATFSSGNAVDCSQDLASRTISSSNDESMSISDLGSVSSSIVIPAQSGITGTVRSLEVNLDIEHTSVGDLTVTLSNGTTTIDLLDRPTTINNDGISMEILNQCSGLVGFTPSIPDSLFPIGTFDQTDLEGFLRPTSIGSIVGNIFTGFESLDANCLFDFLMESDNDNSQLIAGIANQCTYNSFVGNSFVDDFLLVDPDREITEDVFSSFTSIDANCAFDVLSNLDEENGALFCGSDNISVNLSGDMSLLPINMSCESADLVEAYRFPSYSSLQPLSAFEGSSLNEAWTLTVTDSEGGNVGVLNSWSIVFDIER